MRTVTFLMMAFSMAFLSVNAQTPGFTFGIKAGANYSKSSFKNSGVTGTKGDIDANLGVFARVGESIYFQPEVNFVTFASAYAWDGRQYKPKFQQLNVPLMVGYKVINTETFNFRISLGPDLSYNLTKPKAPEGFAYRNWNAGAAINAGVDVGQFTIDARYSHGLTEFNKGLKEKTNVVGLCLGYKFF